MSSSSSLLLHLSPPPPSLLFKPQTSPHSTPLSSHLPKPRTLSLTFSSSSSSSSYEREEARWLREEQRWLREEQRWVREESRWNSERQSLLQEIDSLKTQLQALEMKKLRGSEPNLLLKEVEVSSVNQKRISGTGSSSIPMMLEENKEEEEEVVKEVVVKEVGVVEEEVKKVEKKKMTALRIGAEGDEVQAMQENSNGASVTNSTQVSETKRTVTDDAEVDPSYHKVFLLGENRWEDSSRLIKRDKPTGERVVGISTTKCIACRGEGHILCMECDGTGEPNVESQFLEWVDEGAKCPYCDGLGYSICDVCEGKTIIHP